MLNREILVAGFENGSIRNIYPTLRIDESVFLFITIYKIGVNIIAIFVIIQFR